MTILLHHHLGMGDHIICAGLVNFIAKNNPNTTIVLPSKINNWHSNVCLHSRNKNILINAVSSDNSVKHLKDALDATYYSIGFEKIDKQKFDESFYEQIGLDFKFRYEYFNDFQVNTKLIYQLLQKKNKIDLTTEEYALVHNQSSIGNFDLKINSKLRIVKTENLTNNIFDWIPLIQSAKEIHCIDSAFIHLVESLELNNNCTLFYHKARQTDTKFKLRHKWNEVKY
jgi:hypothetical protein